MAVVGGGAGLQAVWVGRAVRGWGNAGAGGCRVQERLCRRLRGAAGKGVEGRYAAKIRAVFEYIASGARLTSGGSSNGSSVCSPVCKVVRVVVQCVVRDIVRAVVQHIV